MSFLDPGKSSFNWIAAAPVRTSLRRDAGCLQCGNRLEMNDFGKYDASGKCFSCVHWTSDEDEEMEELED